MIKAALIAALVACLGLSGVLALQSTRVARLTTERDQLAASVSALEDGVTQAAKAHAAAADLAEVQRRRATALQHQIENVLTTQYGGCADAPIDPDLLRDLSGGVRPVQAAR